MSQASLTSSLDFSTQFNAIRHLISEMRSIARSHPPIESKLSGVADAIEMQLGSLRGLLDVATEELESQINWLTPDALDHLAGELEMDLPTLAQALEATAQGGKSINWLQPAIKTIVLPDNHTGIGD